MTKRALSGTALIAILMMSLVPAASALGVVRAHSRFVIIAWSPHASSVRTGSTIQVALNRRERSACQLTISTSGVKPESWNYGESSGQIQFAISPSTNTRPGTWYLKALCVPYGTVLFAQTTTVVKVVIPASGKSFLTGPSGPAYEIKLTKGTVISKAIVPTAGRGGDPGNDYPWAKVLQDSGVDPWGEYYRECTSFVAWALHSRNDYNMPFYDNAYNWGIDASRLGIPVDSTPKIGSVAWEPQLPGHWWGHVMWVSDVSGSTVTVEEYNEYGTGTYDSRSFRAGSLPYRYIHFKDLSYSPPTVQLPTPPTSPPNSGSPRIEVTGGVTHTWTNFTNAGGTEGPSIGANQSVTAACKVTGFAVADGNTWWYQISTSPWKNSYYASADAFYNNGANSGSLYGTPFVDNSVPNCANGSSGGNPNPPPSTYAETVGGPTNTWTNYTNAGGSQGPSVATYQTVQISCKLSGFRVADGNTWWYRIASSPWNNSYYASADAFYNNGATSGSLLGTPFVDSSVPNC